jgi:outer membrane receptor protein involved in Fe transport
VRSSTSTVVNARLGWRPTKRLELIADVINLFDREFSDIEYFYESQLRGEAAPVSDIHLHPGEPRAVRLSLRYTFN